MMLKAYTVLALENILALMQNMDCESLYGGDLCDKVDLDVLDDSKTEAQQELLVLITSLR